MFLYRIPEIYISSDELVSEEIGIGTTSRSSARMTDAGCESMIQGAGFIKISETEYKHNLYGLFHSY